MIRLATLAAAVSLATTSCAGGRAASFLPAGTAARPASGSARALRALIPQPSPPPGWAATSTYAFVPSGGSDLGILDPARQLVVRVGLQLHGIDQLTQSAASGSSLSPAAIKSAFGPTASEVAQVTDYLQRQGLRDVVVEPNNLVVSAAGTAGAVSAAFATTLHGYSWHGRNVYANVRPAYVPQALGGIVIAVLGLHDVPTYRTPFHRSHAVPAPSPPASVPPEPAVANYGASPCAVPPGAAGCVRNYTPPDFWRAYDAFLTLAAKNQTIAVMAQGDVSTSISDLAVNQDAFGLQRTPVTVVPVGTAGSDTTGSDEWTLDMTAAAGLAGQVWKIQLYDTATLTDSDVALAFNRWLTDDTARIGTASFGGCELAPYLDGAMLLDDEIFVEAAAQGQTMFAASGDNGSFCPVAVPNGVPAGGPFVEYPAASPYVVSVGGTTLPTQVDGSYQGESAWVAGGGGLSQFEYSPQWESGVQPVGTTAAGYSFRGVPDIAMDGDPQTGMMLYTSSAGWATIGGTSLSSPLAAGAWARIVQRHAQLGFAGPRLYRAYAVGVPEAQTATLPLTQLRGGMHDIQTGSNGAYAALPAYDYTTGMGSLDIDRLNAVVGQ